MACLQDPLQPSGDRTDSHDIGDATAVVITAAISDRSNVSPAAEKTSGRQTSLPPISSQRPIVQHGKPSPSAATASSSPMLGKLHGPSSRECAMRAAPEPRRA